MEEYVIQLEEVEQPLRDCAGAPVGLTDETILERREKVLRGMRRWLLYTSFSGAAF